MNPYESQCKGKRRYGNQQTATWMAEQLLRKGRVLHAYQCDYCHVWHVGHSPGREDLKFGKGHVRKQIKIGRKLRLA